MIVDQHNQSNHNHQSKKKRSTSSQSNEKSKTCNLVEARENATDQDEISAFDWFRERCEFSKPITERNKAKLKQSTILFDTQLKTAL